MAGARARLPTLTQVLPIALLLVALTSVGAASQAPIATTSPAMSSVPATASATPGSAIDTGDPRSDGQGPGLVGEPLLVLLGIVVIGVATVVATVFVARVTGRA